MEEADKLGVARSKYQTWFNKQTTCLSGPFDAIDPGVTEKLDYEVELGLVISRAAKGVGVETAPAHVFGWFTAQRRLRPGLAVPHADIHHGQVVRYAWPDRPLDHDVR